jgi:hypothetical protein
LSGNGGHSRLTRRARKLPKAPQPASKGQFLMSIGLTALEERTFGRDCMDERIEPWRRRMAAPEICSDSSKTADPLGSF